MFSRLFPDFRLKNCFIALLGSAILAFGLYHIHSISNITEGGCLGLVLLLDHWFHISPAVSGFILNGACYLMGWRLLGRSFICYSIVASGGFSLFYAVFEQFPRLFPGIAAYPLLASVTGALFVGVGAGIAVRAGGAPGGDDALAMSISKITPLSIETVYLISDLTVLLLSLTYIPLGRILYSVFTVVLSGQIIGLLQPEHGLYGKIVSHFKHRK